MSVVHVKGGSLAKDLQGLETKSQWWLWKDAWTTTYPNDAIAQAFTELEAYVTLMGDVSLAGFPELMVSEIRGYAGFTITFTGENYALCADKMVLNVLTEAGNVVTPEIPAPKESVLLAGSVDVLDLADAGVAALTAALTSGGVCDAGGNLYTQVVSGYRTGAENTGKNPGGY